ncbi:MAG: pyridoxamine 5'-phosphate oxidase family protein [Chloroflexi bacterium]|nr:pyridoxamine 5'-phosphate oxidase family protein [Chloroflexota bacterium]
MPSYGISTELEGMLPWRFVSEQMTTSRNYWIATTRPDGRPHVAPVWGVWVDDAFYFGTGRTSRKARNLAANPALVVHLESGDDTVILEGTAEVVTDEQLQADDLLTRLGDAYAAKYVNPETGEPFRLEPDPTGSSVVYALRAHMVLAWRESDFPTSATRWRLPRV